MIRETYRLGKHDALTTTNPEADRIILTRCEADHAVISVEDKSVSLSGSTWATTRVLYARIGEVRIIVAGLTITYTGFHEGRAVLVVEHGNGLSVGLCSGVQFGRDSKKVSGDGSK